MRLVCSASLLLGLVACGTDPITNAGFDGTDSGVPGVGGDGSIGGSVAGGSTAGGSTAGGSTGGGSGSDGGLCDKVSVDNSRVTPDMLIVLDRSGSMRNNNVNRWTPSVNGLKAITTSTQASVRFGLMTYPGSGATGAQDCSLLTNIFEQAACFIAGAGAGGLDTCAAGKVDVPLAINNATAIGSMLDSLAPNGSTPTAKSLKAAHDSLKTSATEAGPDQRAGGAQYVLLVTDGQPNCSEGGGGGGGNDATAVTDSVKAIEAMAADGIKTYVLGFDAASNANLSATLNKMAVAGGTGDTKFRPINDQASLQAEFSRIAGSAASCEFTLNQAPSDPDFVRVTLDGATVPLGDANGWVISSGNKKVTIQGSACEKLLGKDNHVVTVEVECERVTLR